MNRIVKIAFLTAAFAWVSVGCSTADEPDDSGWKPTVATEQQQLSGGLELGIPTSSSLPVTTEEGRRLVGADSISTRPASYSLLPNAAIDAAGFRAVPAPRFAVYTDEQVTERLSKAATVFFGSSGPAKAEEHVVALAVDNGIAWAARNNGAFTLKRHDYARGITVVSGAAEAVNLALAQVAHLGVLQLAQHETIDLIGVAATKRAGWQFDSEDAPAKPVYFEAPDGTALTEFRTDFTVTLGRRYRGIPIAQSFFTVRLDAEGKIAAVMKSWRDIVGETKPDQIVSDASINARRNPEFLDLPLAETRCGFIEAEVNGYLQETAGIGCLFEYDNPKGRGTLARRRFDQVDITTARSENWLGQRLFTDEH